MCHHQWAPSKGLPAPHATPFPSHTYPGALGPSSAAWSSQPFPALSPHRGFISPSAFCGVPEVSLPWRGSGSEVKPLPPGGRALSVVGAISSPNRCCEEQTWPLGAATGVTAPSWKLSCGREGTISTSLPPAKAQEMGKEGERGAGAAPSVWSLAGQGEEAQGAVKGKR